MAALALILFILGATFSLIGGIWFLIVAFREHILWGFGCLLIPLVSLVFLIMHWRIAARPFLISLIGSALTIAAYFVAPDTVMREL